MTSAITPVPPVPTDGDYGVRVIRDTSTGAAAILLDAIALSALASFLDGLPLAHDLIGDGYDSAAVDVIIAIAGMIRR